MLLTRRGLLASAAALGATLILPPTLAENAEAVRRYWALDRTMLVTPRYDTAMSWAKVPAGWRVVIIPPEETGIGRWKAAAYKEVFTERPYPLRMQTSTRIVDASMDRAHDERYVQQSVADEAWAMERRYFPHLARFDPFRGGTLTGP